MTRTASPRGAVVAIAVALLFGLAGAQPVCAEPATLAERIVAEHVNDKPAASPLATTAPVQAVNSRPVIYASQDGREISGWLSWPAGNSTAGMPALIVIHEVWGLNESLRSAAERLAGEGYITLAVDLYNGRVAVNAAEAIGLMYALNDAPNAAVENIVLAYDYLSAVMQADKIGVIGWCLGGNWSLQAALWLPTQIAATVIVSGAVSADPQQLAALQMPILGLFGGADEVVPAGEVIAFRESLYGLDKEVDVHIYPSAPHGFANPSSGLAFDPVAAEDAWRRVTGFLARHLQ